MKSSPGGGGAGHSDNDVVHMHDQRNVQKGLFFEAKRDMRLGVKMCLLLRKSRHSTIHVPQKACLGLNFGAKSCEILI